VAALVLQGQPHQRTRLPRQIRPLQPLQQAYLEPLQLSVHLAVGLESRIRELIPSLLAISAQRPHAPWLLVSTIARVPSIPKHPWI